MRAAFLEALRDLAARDRRIVFLTGDLGFSFVEPFAGQFPDRFFNVGVAEQNMVGLATGLAEAGLIPFVYSMAPFAVLRPYEFIRNGPVQHNLPVRIVAVGAGFDYGPAGFTHFGLEDLAALRAQPNLHVIVPSDDDQARTALARSWDLPGPVYFRLAKNETPSLPGLRGAFKLGRAQLLRPGGDALLVATGTIARHALQAAEQLEAEGVRCGVSLVSCLLPAPTASLIEHIGRARAVVTVEAHYRTGGLGSLVAELVAEEQLGCRVVRCGVSEAPVCVTGGERFLLDKYGLSADGLARTVRAALAGSGRD